MTNQGNQKRVLALDVHPHSFGFVVFEGPNDLLDWGVKSFRPGVNAVKIPAAKKIFGLLDGFSPSVIVVRERETERSANRTHILATVQRLARTRNIPLRFISHGAITKAFAGSESNKHEVASALTQQFSFLVSRLPPRRKCWQSEDYRMSIFDAAAAGVAYFARRKQLPAATDQQTNSTEPTPQSPNP